MAALHRLIPFGLLLIATNLAGCISADEQDALRVQANKEWQNLPGSDDWHNRWNREHRQTDQSLIASCAQPDSRERTLSQNGVNDEVSYRQCPPLAPRSTTAPLPQPWPPTMSGQRLDPRS